MSVTASPEDVRLSIGLSKTQWNELENERKPRQISASWEKFKRHVTRALDIEFADPAFVLDGSSYITSVQAARALGVGEFHLSNLRDRDKLQGIKHGRRHIYAREHLDALLRTPEDGRRAPLASAFLRWMELNEG